MGECDKCGEKDVTYKCSYCDQRFCSEHRLPENHECPGLDDVESSKWFDQTKKPGHQPSTKTPIEQSDETGLSDKAKSMLEDNDQNDVAKNQGSNDNSQANDESEDYQEPKDNNIQPLKFAKNCSNYFLTLAKIALSKIAKTTKNLLSFTLKVTFNLAKWLFYIAFTFAAIYGVIQFLDDTNGLENDSGMNESREENNFGASGSEVEDLDIEAPELDDYSEIEPIDEPDNSPILDVREVEQEVHEEANRHRNTEGLSTLNFDEELADIARLHSNNMLEHDFMAHEDHLGREPWDRAEDEGYNCRVSDGHIQYDVGENIAQSFFDMRVRTDDGSTVIYSNEQELAEGLVEQWVNSPEHRENMEEDFWENQGLGIAFNEENNVVYATQKFC